MTTADAYDVATILHDKTATLQSTLNTSGYKTEIDAVSAQTYYGVPDALIDNLKQAIDLVILSMNIANMVIAPTTLV